MVREPSRETCIVSASCWHWTDQNALKAHKLSPCTASWAIVPACLNCYGRIQWKRRCAPAHALHRRHLYESWNVEASGAVWCKLLFFTDKNGVHRRC